MPDGPPVQSREGAEGRDRIIDSALHLFATRGYGRTTTKLISEHAGVATGLLFYHFASKDELLRGVLIDRTFAPELAILVPDEVEVLEPLLQATGKNFVRLLRANGEYITVLMASRDIASDLFHAFQFALDAAADDLASRLPAQRGITVPLARTAARAYLGALWTSVLVLPARGSDRALVRHTSDLMCAALVTS